MAGKLKRIAASFFAAMLLVQQCNIISLAADTSADIPETEAAAEGTITSAESESGAADESAEASKTSGAADESEKASEAPDPEDEPEEAVKTSGTADESREAAVTSGTTDESEEAASVPDETDESEPLNFDTDKTEESRSSPEQSESSSAQSETDTAALSEKEDKSEAEKELQEIKTARTERSARENSGEKIKRSDLEKSLSEALPYLFVSESVTVPAAYEKDEALKGLILDGKEAGEILDGLKEISLKLADAKSSSDVTVINIYADEDGSLDTAQLEKIFPDKAIDVTDNFYLINVIACSEDQDLTFSGFDLKKSGKAYEYTDDTQPGNIIYNFAALKNDAYTDYKGEIKLTGDFQGTVLAPAASVVQKGSLEGAVYAEKVEVSNAAAKLLCIVFSEGRVHGNTISVSAEVLYGDVVLTAEKDMTYYAALFCKNGDTREQAGEVGELALKAGTDISEKTVFEDLPCGTYYVTAVDKAGNPLKKNEASGAAYADILEVMIPDGSENTEKSVILQYVYESEWPENDFSYTTDIKITVKTSDRDGSPLSTDESFYMNIYRDQYMTSAENDTPIEIPMGQGSTKTVSYELKATKTEQIWYIEETLSDGSPVNTGVNFAYIVSFDKSGAVTSVCGGAEPSVTVQNKLNDSTVKIRVEDENTGSAIAGASLAIKDSSGNIYRVSAAEGKTFNSGTEPLEWVNVLTDNETYYLTEITAPDGYTPVPDVSFTVEPGLTTEVVLGNKPEEATSYALTVTKEVYVGDTQVYAYDTTAGTYRKNGAYTFYMALFSDSARTQKVSDVMSLDVSGFTGSAVFSNLTKDGVYYVSETDEYGIVQTSSQKLTVRYTDSGKVTMSQKSRTVAVQNIYTSLPGGYRYTGVINITLNVTDSTGAAQAVTDTFYAGIYRNADYSDAPTVVKLNLKNASSVTVRKRILLSGRNDMTYYIAEVDSAGNRIQDSSEFPYVVSIDNPAVTVSGGSSKNVTITNKAKVSKVTLYLTKKVYEGVIPKSTDETFYAGLFRDENLTELYTDPVAINLNGAAEQTLKLTLNMQGASEAAVYIAEVDKDGNVIRDEQSFGYQIRLINAAAVFTQDRMEIQTVIMNSVYGTTSDAEWDEITGSISGTLAGDPDYYSFGENGYVNFDGTEGVQTGDNTPLYGYMILMGAALAVAGIAFRRIYTAK